MSIRPEREGAEGEAARAASATQGSQSVGQEVVALYPVESEEVGGLAGARMERSRSWAGFRPTGGEPTRGWDSIRSLSASAPDLLAAGTEGVPRPDCAASL